MNNEYSFRTALESASKHFLAVPWSGVYGNIINTNTITAWVDIRQ